MHCYPVALQDPGCKNIYVTYSISTHDSLSDCMNVANMSMCQSRPIEMYIKFTIITEEWVVNSHNWGPYESKHCSYKINDNFLLNSGMRVSNVFFVGGFMKIDIKSFNLVVSILLVAFALMLGVLIMLVGLHLKHVPSCLEYTKKVEEHNHPFVGTMEKGDRYCIKF